MHWTGRLARDVPRALLLFTLLFLPACGSDDDGGTGPNGGDPGGIPQDGSDLQAIGEFGLQALATGEEVSASVETWLAGFGTARATTPTWNPQTQAWEWSEEEVLQFTPTTNELRSWTWSVQYLNGQTPQQTPAGATGILANVSMQYSFGDFQSETDNRTMSASLECEIQVTGLDQPAQNVEVNGSGQVNADFTIRGKFSEFATDVVSLNVQFTRSPGSCPVGDGVLAVNGTFVEWTWEGGAGYQWTLTRGDVLASGSATLPCGN